MKIEMIPVKSDTQIQEVATLAFTIWNEHFVPIIGQQQVDYMVAKFQSYPTLKEQIANGYEYFLLKTNDIFVGYVGIHIEGDALFLSKLYLLNTVRHKGISRQAFHFLTELSKMRDLKRIWLTCNKYNEDTLAVYKHFGFQVIDSCETDIGEGYIMDDYILEYMI
jgi:Acetyltransferase (GNAT) family.